MEHKKTMLDYIADCPEFISNNVADSAALTLNIFFVFFILF